MEDDYQRYRREQEEAVSNQSGSSAGEVLFAISPNVCSILVTLTVITMSGPNLSYQSRILLEFCFAIMPCILSCTVLSEHVMGISQIFLIIASANILVILALKQKNSFVTNTPPKANNRIPFITNFRALTNILTAVCILAVDFPCFPRKHVKTETYGYSLMDTGVGLFIVANAVVSPEARNVVSDAKVPFLKGLRKNIEGCLPLLVLGLGRYVSVEFLGYQKHVTEYGVHWNFFLTLAAVRLFTGLLSRNQGSKYSLITGLWILVMHEYALSTKGLKEWVLSDEPRNDLLSANREGWVSIPGYVGLYLLGVALGRLIYSTYQNNDCQQLSNVTIFGYELHIGYTKSMLLTVKLYIISSIAFVVTLYCEKYFQTSRRLANSGYCVWILTLSTLVLTFLILIEVILECVTGCVREKARRKFAKHLRRDDLNAKEYINITKTLEIFEAVNDNGLSFFLFANILTGAINMTMKTLHTDDSRAVVILMTYMAVNVAFVLLRRKGYHMLRKSSSSKGKGD